MKFLLISILTTFYSLNVLATDEDPFCLRFKAIDNKIIELEEKHNIDLKFLTHEPAPWASSFDKTEGLAKLENFLNNKTSVFGTEDYGNLISKLKELGKQSDEVYPLVLSGVESCINHVPKCINGLNDVEAVLDINFSYNRVLENGENIELLPSQLQTDASKSRIVGWSGNWDEAGNIKVTEGLGGIHLREYLSTNNPQGKFEIRGYNGKGYDFTVTKPDGSSLDVSLKGPYFENGLGTPKLKAVKERNIQALDNWVSSGRCPKVCKKIRKKARQNLGNDNLQLSDVALRDEIIRIKVEKDIEDTISSIKIDVTKRNKGEVAVDLMGYPSDVRNRIKNAIKNDAELKSSGKLDSIMWL